MQLQKLLDFDGLTVELFEDEGSVPKEASKPDLVRPRSGVGLSDHKQFTFHRCIYKYNLTFCQQNDYLLSDHAISCVPQQEEIERTRNLLICLHRGVTQGVNLILSSFTG